MAASCCFSSAHLLYLSGCIQIYDRYNTYNSSGACFCPSVPDWRFPCQFLCVSFKSHMHASVAADHAWLVEDAQEVSFHQIYAVA